MKKCPLCGGWGEGTLRQWLFEALRYKPEVRKFDSQWVY